MGVCVGSPLGAGVEGTTCQGWGSAVGAVAGRNYWKINGEEWQKSVISSMKDDQ